MPDKADIITRAVSSVLSIFSPSVATRWRSGRMAYRAYASGELRGSDALYAPRLTSADAEIKAASHYTIARCREQAQNNPSISGQIERTCTNVVRDGIYPLFNFKNASGDIDEGKNKLWNDAFIRWSKKVDPAGFDHLVDIQKIVLSTFKWTDGNVFAHRVYDKSAKGVNPLRIELIESDQLDTSIDGKLKNDNFARLGIEYYKDTKRPVRYHFYKESESGSFYGMEKISYPAKDIIHVWQRKRASQSTGMAGLHAVVMEASRMEDFRVTTQNAARTQSRTAAYIKTDDPNFKMGGGLPVGGQLAPGMTSSATNTDPIQLDGNIIQPLPPGTDVKFLAPTHPGTMYEPFVKESQRSQSSGMNASFEAFANNYTDSSYASSLSSKQDERLEYKGLQSLLDRKFNAKVIEWFFEAAFFSSTAPTPMVGYAQDPEGYLENVTEKFPGWTSIQADKDIKADMLRVDFNVDTKTDISAKAGKNWTAIMDKRSKELDEEIKLEKKKSILLALQNPLPTSTENTGAENDK